MLGAVTFKTLKKDHGSPPGSGIIAGR